jgi:hypothetical protein
MDYKIFEILNGYKVVMDDSSDVVESLADYIDSSDDYQTTEIRKLRGISQSVIIISGYNEKCNLSELVHNFFIYHKHSIPTRDGFG